MATTCEEETLPACEVRFESLAELRLDIETLVSTSVCNADFECRYMAFGSKPCGGPWSYLIYSTSIDTLELKHLVDVYNIHESLYNTECGGSSDCSIENPPIDITCENYRCIAIY